MVKNPHANAGDIGEGEFDPWVRKISWRRKQQPTAVFLPRESHGRGAWQVTVHSVAKSQTWLKWLCRHARLSKGHHNAGRINLQWYGKSYYSTKMSSVDISFQKSVGNILSNCFTIVLHGPWQSFKCNRIPLNPLPLYPLYQLFDLIISLRIFCLQSLWHQVLYWSYSLVIVENLSSLSRNGLK